MSRRACRKLASFALPGSARRRGSPGIPQILASVPGVEVGPHKSVEAARAVARHDSQDHDRRAGGVGSRNQMNDFIERAERRSSSSLSKKSILVVSSEGAGSKRTKAETLGIRMAIPNEFAALVADFSRASGGTPSPVPVPTASGTPHCPSSRDRLTAAPVEQGPSTTSWLCCPAWPVRKILASSVPGAGRSCDEGGGRRVRCVGRR